LEKIKLFTETAGVSPARAGNACSGLVDGIYRDAGAGETPAVPVKSLPHTAVFKIQHIAVITSDMGKAYAECRIGDFELRISCDQMSSLRLRLDHCLHLLS